MPTSSARRLHSIATTAVVLFAVACSRPAAADVVARIGGTDVTGEEIRAYVETLGPQERATLSKDPALLSQVVRTYLAREAVLREARAKKWDQQPLVKAQLDRARDQALTELYLQSVSRPPDGYPSEAEVQAAYEVNKAAFEAPRQYRVAQIFIAAPKGGGKDDEERARKRLEDVTRKLGKKAVDFPALASGSSDEKAGGQRGGEIGWLAAEQMVPGIRATVASLAKDAISDPIRLDDGWHIIKVLDTRPVSTRPLAEVRDALAAQLRADRAKANRQAYLARLLEQNPPAINELVLSRVLAGPR